MVDEIQVSCYKILESLYTIGTDLQLTRARKFLRTEIGIHRSSIGTCLAALSSTFPVAFLEPTLSKYNPFSVNGSGFAQRSLEAQGTSFLSIMTSFQVQKQNKFLFFNFHTNNFGTIAKK